MHTHVSPMLLNGWSSNGPWLRKVWVITRGFIPNYLSSTVLDRISPRERRAQPLQVERWGTVLEIHCASTDFLGRCQTISSLGNFGSGIFVMEASLFLVSSKFWTLSHGAIHGKQWGRLRETIEFRFFSPKRRQAVLQLNLAPNRKKGFTRLLQPSHRVCDRARQVTGRPSLATLAVGGGNPEMKPGKPGFYPKKGDSINRFWVCNGRYNMITWLIFH